MEERKKKLGSQITQVYKYIRSSNVRRGIWHDMLSGIEEKQTYKKIKEMLTKLVHGTFSEFQDEATDSDIRRHSLSEISIMTYTVDTVLAEILHCTYQNVFRTISQNIMHEAANDTTVPQSSLSNGELNLSTENFTEDHNLTTVSPSPPQTSRKRGRPKKKILLTEASLEKIQLESSIDDIALHLGDQMKLSDQTPTISRHTRGRPKGEEASVDSHPETRLDKTSNVSTPKKVDSLKVSQIDVNSRKIASDCIASHSGDQKALSPTAILTPRPRGRPKTKNSVGSHPEIFDVSLKKVDSLKVSLVDVDSEKLVPQNDGKSSGIASHSGSHSNVHTLVKPRGRPKKIQAIKTTPKTVTVSPKNVQNMLDPVVRLAVIQIPENTPVSVSPKSTAEAKTPDGSFKRQRGRPSLNSPIILSHSTPVNANITCKDESESDMESELSIESVSSVHTSELSSFEDNVSVGSDNENKKRKKVPLKIAEDLYLNGQLSKICEVESKDDSARKVALKNRKHIPCGSKITALGKIRKFKKISVLNSFASRGKRIRKPNSKYFSDAVFHSSKEYLTQPQTYAEDKTNEQRKSPVKDRPSYPAGSPRRTNRAPSKDAGVTSYESLQKYIVPFQFTNTNKRYNSSDLYKPRVAIRRTEP